MKFNNQIEMSQVFTDILKSFWYSLRYNTLNSKNKRVITTALSFQLCLSDESIFEITEESSQYVWIMLQEEFHHQCIEKTVKHPTKVVVSSIMSVHGNGRLYIF